jgi:hypothetical protein
LFPSFWNSVSKVEWIERSYLKHTVTPTKP